MSVNESPRKLSPDLPAVAALVERLADLCRDAGDWPQSPDITAAQYALRDLFFPPQPGRGPGTGNRFNWPEIVGDLTPGVRAALSHLRVYMEPRHFQLADRATLTEIAAMIRGGADGPTPAGKLRRKGVEHDLTRQQWRLANCLWGRECVSIEEVDEAVWGDSAPVSDSALGKALSAFNALLAEIGVPWVYGRHGRNVVRR
jgi:hypothetical protein